ncbi:hypothetical protein JCM30471_31770 [Desulfuromonas carbonis]|uniref:hypothetical protein n=1 Tax=Desulfuromonas sp. DDH964 TaxID=1823759 RepID=UPI00078C9DE1|nr:hypothetical protein [Desulfuromonas sp. DDH964]AMV71340.1 hypothetical protein DBW_0958 [Desulfuromonas sp. DDH964]
MKNALTLLVAGLMALGLAVGCKNETPKTAETPAPATAPAAAPAAKGKSGTVLETMNSGGYTYVQVDTGTEKIWAAAPEFQVKVGDAVVVPEGMAMANYHSKTLDRDFEMVYFVDGIMVGGAEAMAQAAQMPENHPVANERTKVDAAPVDLKGITKAEGGNTVADVFTNKEQLVGKEVKIRGKVVKFSPEIMGKNWIHLQDGTGAAGSNDLTVTTNVAAKVGDTVLVVGKVVADKDFGYGYKYDVILEDAQVTVE